MASVSAVIEGPSDEGAVRAIIRESGHDLARILGRRGRTYIEKNLKGFNEAARVSPWFVLIDLDNAGKCPGDLRAELIKQQHDQLIFRIAVVELEAWLLADREKVARFLSVSEALIPPSPETLAYPKEHLIGIARRSRSRTVREGLVPREGSGSQVGREYVSMINEFSERSWRADVAAETAPSLRRCMERLRSLT
jgi:hypothetical protein